MRDVIRAEIAAIIPLDEQEKNTQIEVLQWIDSGQALYRTKKPATPPKHLVAYFAVVDGDYLLLVDHINAQLWLPTGGHVEPGEHPRNTALREAKEELNMDGEFLHEAPLLITSTETVGITQGHTDVSVWYTLKGDRLQVLEYDQSEFNTIRWFHRNDIPMAKTDPEMARFLEKLYAVKSVKPPA